MGRRADSSDRVGLPGSRRLRVAMLCLHADPGGHLGTRTVGGMSVYVQAMASQLGRLGHRVDVFTRMARAEARVIAPGVRVIGLADLAGDAVADARLVERCRTRLAERYDVVHSHYWTSCLVGRRLCARWGAPHVVTFHTLAGVKAAAHPASEPPVARIRAEADLLAENDGIIALSPLEQAALLARPMVSSARVYRVPGGVDLDRFDLGPRARSDEDRPHVLYVGRFAAIKDLPGLLRAVAAWPSNSAPRLTLIGGDGFDSPEVVAMRALATRLGISDRLAIPGPVEHHALPPWYRAADVVVVPSRAESFGLVILEALACGTPVASTRVGIAPQVVRNGINGHLARPGDTESLSRAIQAAIEVGRERTAARIRSTVERYTWWAAAQGLLDAYRVILARPSAAIGHIG